MTFICRSIESTKSNYYCKTKIFSSPLDYYPPDVRVINLMCSKIV